MDQEVLSNELRFYGLSYVDYVVYAYSKLRRPGQHLRPATLITAFVQIHPDHDWTHQVVMYTLTEACLSRVYPIECEPTPLNSCVAMSEDILQGQTSRNLLSLYTNTKHM